MADQSPDLKAAYERLDETVREIIRLEEWPGLVTDWVVLAANQYFADNGRSMSDVGQILPDGGDTVPYYRLMGMLDYALAGLRGNICFSLGDGEEDQ